MSALTMPTKGTKEWQAKHQANCAALERLLKSNGFTKSRRRKLFNAAAAGRPADLADKVRADRQSRGAEGRA
ncbi:hypothetical protein GCM10007989_07600 [Devosia pacifica]|uniref:Uncharacterized protein n=1 Tax=Devosia pacifica TaxID=1335967 RepID=A0A918RY00_9HYPH|nr:hypothetical protein [Devosia pacifica]GHA15313.1 hypothetical protein GCM10007989_07600 [Devosia pacifica]